MSKGLVLLTYLYDKIEDVIDIDWDLYKLSLIKDLKINFEEMKMSIQVMELQYHIRLEEVLSSKKPETENTNDNIDNLLILSYLRDQINVLLDSDNDEGVKLIDYLKIENNKLIAEGWHNTYEIKIDKIK